MILTRDGVPGEHWFNLTAEVWFQWEVAPGCCELCLRLDSQMVRDLRPPLHEHCRCQVARVRPLEWSPRPFRSFREKALSIRGAWRVDLFGLSNLLLVKAGVVTLDDLIAGDRILDFAEVVQRKKLEVDQLVAARIHPAHAARAVAVARRRMAAAAKAKSPQPAAKVEVP
jgi:hypothetical protein